MLYLGMSELTTTDKTIREALKRTMREKGLTQAALAERLGIKQPSVADILTGRRGRQPESLLNLLDAVGLELTIREKAAEKGDDSTDPPYLALAGMFDDPNSPGDVSVHHDFYIGEGLERDHEEAIRGNR
jgi:transcriptional regulator with XRE-family HTH domain